jgi:hypothetical protein
MTLPLAEILQRHSDLIRIYYKFIFPYFFDKQRNEVMAEFFQGHCASKVEHQMTRSGQYIQYLKDRGFYTADEEVRKERDWLEKAQRLQEELGIDKI